MPYRSGRLNEDGSNASWRNSAAAGLGSQASARCAPDDPFAKALRQNYNKLEEDKASAVAAIAHLDVDDKKHPAKPTSSDLDYLEALPHLRLNLAKAPQALLRPPVRDHPADRQGPCAGDQVTITIKTAGRSGTGNSRSRRKDQRRDDFH